MKFTYLFCFLLTFVVTKGEDANDYLEEEFRKAVVDDERKCVSTAGELVFILDASTSVGPDDFNKEKDFATKIVDRLAVGSNLTRVALITYNSFPSLVFNLHQYDRAKEINEQIMKAPFTEGITVVGDALDKVLKEIEPKTRPKMGKMIVLISDGKANGGMDPFLVAKQLKSNNYTIITIGLDKDSDEAAMKAISTNNMYYVIKNFDALDKIVSSIVTISCITFHRAKCPKEEVKKDACINEKQAVHVTSYYYRDGKCIPEYRKLSVNCVNPNECQKPFYSIARCSENANTTDLLNVTFIRMGERCAQKVLKLKEVTCGCPKETQTTVNVITGKDCDNGLKSQLIVYNEFRQMKCQQSFFTLTAVKCQDLCKGTKSVTGTCVAGVRTNQMFVKKFVNNKCELVLHKSTTSKCATSCPNSVKIMSKQCINKMRNVTLISFENVNMVCVQKTTKLDPVKCNDTDCPPPRMRHSICINNRQMVLKISYARIGSQCKRTTHKVGVIQCTPKRCQNSTYEVRKCEKDSKSTFLVKTYFRKSNGTCVKMLKNVKELSCKCYTTTKGNITVTIGKTCDKGYRSRELVVQEERQGKCVDVKFTLRRRRCIKRCLRRRYTVTKCKGGKREVVKASGKLVNGKCEWKIEKKKVVDCKEVCPKPQRRTTRCILGKQVLLEITFKEDGPNCKGKVVRLNISKCNPTTRCQNSTYAVEKCDKSAKSTFLVKTYYETTNGACVKKTKKVKELSCKCYQVDKRNITVTVGKICDKGYRSRDLVVQEERQGKCVDVKFTLRRRRCQNPCRRLRYTVTKCKGGKREVVKSSGKVVNGKCEWKIEDKRIVECKEVCPKPRQKTTRCILRKRFLLEITFKEDGNNCKATVKKLKIMKCEKEIRCRNSTYEVAKCNKDAKTTSLIRTYYVNSNGKCVQKTRKVKELSCKCYQITKGNITVTIGKTCEKGFHSRELVLQEERQGRCVDVKFTLRRIKCIKRCLKREFRVTKCNAGKREVAKYRQELINGICDWKMVNKKVEPCTTPCPTNRNKTTRCILGKKALLQITFKEEAASCKVTVVRLKMIKCEMRKKCRNTTFEVEKCNKDSKTTFLIATYYNTVNGACMKRTKKVKEVSCKCYENRSRDVLVTIGKICEKGYHTRELILHEERKGQCVDVKFRLRRLKCVVRCLKREYRMTACKNKKREISRFQETRVDGKCEWKFVDKRVVDCKNVCPLNKQKTTRCVSGKQALLEIKFKETTGRCLVTVTRLKMLTCNATKVCLRSRYHVEKCERGSKTTFLTRTSFSNVNGTCVKKVQKLKTLPCTCYEKVTGNLTITIGKKCEDGFKSRDLILFEERLGKCVDVRVKLRRIRCQRDCDGVRTVPGPCENQKRVVKSYENVRVNGSCTWKFIRQSTVNCSNPCPLPKTSETPCLFAKKALIRTTYTLVGKSCIPKVEKLQLLGCKSCRLQSFYKVENCTKGSATSNLVRIISKDCKNTVEVLKKVDCSCYQLNRNTLKISTASPCIKGLRSRIVYYYDKGPTTCIQKQITVGNLKCGCSGVNVTISVCKNGNRTLTVFKKENSNGKCVEKKVSTRSMRCNSVCPTKMVKKSKCIKKRQFEASNEYKQVGDVCIVVNHLIKWSNCTINTIDSTVCSKKVDLVLSTCVKGNASIIARRKVKKDGKCMDESRRVAVVECTDKCERTVRPKLVAGSCENNEKLMFSIATRAQDGKCYNKVTYLGKIKCKVCK